MSPMEEVPSSKPYRSEMEEEGKGGWGEVCKSWQPASLLIALDFTNTSRLPHAGGK